MPTVFEDPLFSQISLKTGDNKEIKVILDDERGTFNPGLNRNDSEGFCTGNMVNPEKIPAWMIPGTIFTGTVYGFKMTLTFEPILQSSVALVSDILGDEVRFSYVIVSEFN